MLSLYRKRRRSVLPWVCRVVSSLVRPSFCRCVSPYRFLVFFSLANYVIFKKTDELTALAEKQGTAVVHVDPLRFKLWEFLFIIQDFQNKGSLRKASDENGSKRRRDLF